MILGGTLFFLAKALKTTGKSRSHPNRRGMGYLAIWVLPCAHLVGWVWTWILYELNQPVSSSQFSSDYKTIAKYLPGNVWHYYGRITAAKTAGVSGSAAT